MTYKFKTPRKPAKTETFAIPREPKEPVFIAPVQGIMPDSQQEYWFAVWLDRKRLAYKFQYLVFPGAKHYYNIDFVVYTVPLWTMVELNGGFWHYGELGQDDKLRQLRIEAHMQSIAKTPIEFLWAPDMINRETVEAAGERIFPNV